MTVDPVLPVPALAALALAILALRVLTLRRGATSGTGRRGVLRWTLTTTALMLVVLAAARPGLDTPPAQAGPAGDNVFFLVDLSADSAIDDFGGATRMSAIRDDIETLMAAHDGARFGVITFTSRPTLRWPLSDDTWSLQALVDTLAPATGPAAASAQANAAAAANVLRYQLIAARQRYPRADEVVYYFGSGAPGSAAPQSSFDGDAVDGGAVFGYGGAAGATALRAVADHLGVSYVDRSAGQPVQAAQPEPASAAAATGSPERTEYYWLPAMLASALLLAEIALSVRDLRSTRLVRHSGRRRR